MGSRYNKLKQQMSQHSEHIEDYLNSVKRQEQQRQSQRLHYSEWNYLNICIQQLLKLNSENMGYHLLAIQVYQSHPDESLTNKYLEAAIASCDIGVNLCLLHLNGHHQSFYVWITTFFVLKAQILFQQRKWKQVIQCILPSLKYQQSDNIHLLYNLRASAYCEMKQFREAIADYGLAIDRSEEPSSYYNSRGTCWHELRAYDKALADYNAAIESNKKCVSAYNNRASLYVDMKQYEMALFDADTGLFIYENHGNLYKHRGLAHFYLKHYNQCLLDIQKSIQFAPKYRPARVALKMIWDFFYNHLIEIICDIHDGYIHSDVCKLLIDYMVGDNYETDEDMVDATYADWKKEMALMEQEKKRIESMDNKTNHDDDDRKEENDDDEDEEMN